MISLSYNEIAASSRLMAGLLSMTGIVGCRAFSTLSSAGIPRARK
jgi:hypothetical protein